MQLLSPSLEIFVGFYLFVFFLVCLDVNWLDKLVERNHVKFNKGKCQILTLGTNNSRHQNMLWTTQVESGLEEIALWVLLDTKLTVSQQRRRWHPGQSASRRSREVSLPLCSVLVTHVWSGMSSTGPPKTMVVMKWLEHLSYEDRLRDMGLLSLGKRKPSWILSMWINTWWEEWTWGSQVVFSGAQW